MKIDRRAIASILAFGLKTPYITIPAGFGLIFHNLIADNMIQNGMQVARNYIWEYTWILGIGMLTALLIALFVSYRKPREYKQIDVPQEHLEKTKFNKNHLITIIAAFATFAVIGLVGSLLLFFGANVIANQWLQIPDAEMTLVALSPAIFFVAIICVFRGYLVTSQ